MQTSPLALAQQGRARRVLTRVFYAAYLVTFGWVVLNIAFTTTNNSLANTLLAGLLGVGLCLLYRRFAPALDALDKKSLHRVVGILFGLYALAMLVMGVLLRQVPVSDFAIVLKAAQNLVETGSLGELNNYFSQCPNNFGVLLLYYLWFKPLSWLGVHIGSNVYVYEALSLPDASHAALTAGTVLCVIALVLSVFLLWRCAAMLYDGQAATLLALLLAFLFAPYLLWSSNFYTDTLSTPFIMGGLYLWLRAQRSEGRAGWACYGLSAACIFAGFKVKGSVAILLVAVLCALLMRLPLKKALVRCGVMLGVFLVLQGVFTLYIHNNRWYDDTGWRDIQPPVWNWFALASHGDGEACQCERCLDMQAPVGYAERTRRAKAWLAENYAGYTTTGLVEFLNHKAVLTWGRGHYEALDYAVNRTGDNITRVFVLPTQPLHAPLKYYCNAYNLMLLLGLCWALVCSLRWGRFSRRGVLHLALFGAFVFFSFYETHARYILNLTPLLILAATEGLARFAQLLPRRTKTHPADGEATAL